MACSEWNVPCAPVMPWQMTRVALLIRIDIRRAGPSGFRVKSDRDDFLILDFEREFPRLVIPAFRASLRNGSRAERLTERAHHHGAVVAQSDPGKGPVGHHQRISGNLHRRYLAGAVELQSRIGRKAACPRSRPQRIDKGL